MERTDKLWTILRTASFSGEYNDNDVRLSPDGNTIFWRSWRPLPGKSIPEEHSVIWYARKTPEGWGAAEPIRYGDTFLKAGYPSITKEGVLFLSTRLKDNIGENDIYKSTFKSGMCDYPKNLGSVLNTEYSEGDLYVSPDESFLIVSCWDRPENNGDSDLYISFRDRMGEWSALKNMGEPINTRLNENCPSFSPDGKYFFFMAADLKTQSAKSHTYWVDAKIIEDLKPKELK